MIYNKSETLPFLKKRMLEMLSNLTYEANKEKELVKIVYQ